MNEQVSDTGLGEPLVEIYICINMYIQLARKDMYAMNIGDYPILHLDTVKEQCFYCCSTFQSQQGPQE